MPLMRSYEVAHLSPTGEVIETRHRAPAHSFLDDCFAVLARGALLRCPEGETPIEDLLPGDQVMTSDGPHTIRWKGTMSLGAQQSRLRLLRVMPQSFGVMSPHSDLVLGPRARILRDTPALRRRLGGPAYVPIGDFVDSDQVTQVTPPSAVTLFQIGFSAHCEYSVNGMWVESLLANAPRGLSRDLAAGYGALMPHLRPGQPMQPRHRRLNPGDLELIEAA